MNTGPAASTSSLCKYTGDVLILVTFAFSSSFVFILSRSTFIPITAAAAALFVFSVILRNPYAVHLSLFSLLVPLSALYWPRSWPFALLAPLLPYAIITAMIPQLRRTVHWLKKGKFDITVRVLMAITVPATALGLILWFLLAKTDLRVYLAKIPHWTGAELVLAGIGFGLLNAAIEENIFRGIIMQSLGSVFGPAFPTIVLQGISFGLIHIRGIPAGLSGIVLAAVYGWMQGVIRTRSRGLLAPYITHVCADIIIFFILAFWLSK